jgi:hypothetical protein
MFQSNYAFIKIQQQQAQQHPISRKNHCYNEQNDDVMATHELSMINQGK